MDAATGLTRMRDLLRPGGVLAIVGLARHTMPRDLPYTLAGVVAGTLHRAAKGHWHHPSPTVWPPPVTYRQMRALATEILPGSQYRRHLLLRYSITWRKPPRLTHRPGVRQGPPGRPHPPHRVINTGTMPEQHTDTGGSELGRFLRARRTQTTPAEVGLTVGPGLRRTPGLRREELATLAGVSIDYYTRLERGKETRPGPGVVDALARALRLEADEHHHLRELAARAARHPSEPPPVPSRTVRDHLKLLLETMRPNPAYILSRSMDLLAHNPGGLALYAGIADWPPKQRNLARYLFLHPTARELFPDWHTQVRGCAARLRAQAGTDPDAPDLTNLVGELLLKSPDFAKLWERYDVKGRKPPHKTFHHPHVGQITLASQSMHLEGTQGQRLGVYLAQPGTPDHDALLLLDMTTHQPDAEHTHH
ncbi:helix-turn-helix transcriptional regulator [Sphaerisporangium fuscum]|uniref:helix-turn-helix transcriptional regulator n=1 Tax=Sphaerisporangium fuscum TaxID=2835868 RepID=UPI0020299F7C|nr:helix-turn-helix transcriptional regulator [Sphaerisporangium fuscum]